MTNKSHRKLGLWRTCISCSLRKFSLQGSGQKSQLRIVSCRSNVYTCRRYGNYISLRYQYTPKLTILQVVFFASSHRSSYDLSFKKILFFHKKKNCFYAKLQSVTKISQRYLKLFLTDSCQRVVTRITYIESLETNCNV